MKTFVMFWITVGFIGIGYAQTTVQPTKAEMLPSISISDKLTIPEDSSRIIQLLDFKNMDIKDVIRSLAAKYDLNIFIDNNISKRITIRLTQIPMDKALQFIVDENGLELIKDGNVYKIIQPEIEIVEPEPEPLKITLQHDCLSMDIENEDLGKVVRCLSDVSQKNIIINKGVNEKISGLFKNIPFEEGLFQLMKSNGFVAHKKKNIIVIDRDRFWENENDNTTKRNCWITVQDSLITLDVVNADLNIVLRELGSQLGVSIFSYGDLKGQVNAQCSDVNFEKVLNYLFKGSQYTYRRDGDIYFIGDKNISGIASTQLICLKFIKVEGIIEMLPPSIVKNANLQIIKEHNAIMAVGAHDVINELEEYIKKIDYPIPQILIKAIVVDFTSSDIGEFGLSAFMKSGSDSSVHANSYFPTLDISASGNVLNKKIQLLGPSLGMSNLGKLPDNFMVNLKALESEGKANIRSQPQIATLNGHPASIKIGTTQYYKLNSERPIVGGNQAFNQVTQRFEKITAEISLTITPWVSASGEITTEIKPEFSTPRGFDPEVPPTIDHRMLDSTVRLRDGETIILGGLIQEDNSNNVSKLPILGDIPILGKLFQNRTRKKVKSKLIIYITPHLMYTDDVFADQRGVP